MEHLLKHTRGSQSALSGSTSLYLRLGFVASRRWSIAFWMSLNTVETNSKPSGVAVCSITSNRLESAYAPVCIIRVRTQPERTSYWSISTHCMSEFTAASPGSVVCSVKEQAGAASLVSCRFRAGARSSAASSVSRHSSSSLLRHMLATTHGAGTVVARVAQKQQQKNKTDSASVSFF